jgi:hypothetical protein
MTLDIMTSVAMAWIVALQTAGSTASDGISQTVTDSLNDFVQTIVAALPSVIAALILLGIGFGAGRAVGWAVEKIAVKMNADKYWANTGIGRSISRAGWSFGRLISVASRWFVYLFFISAAVNALQFQQLSEALNAVWLWIPNVIAFIVVLVLGAIITDFVGDWIQKELPQRGIAGGKTIGIASRGLLYAIVLAIAITQLRIGELILNTVISALVWGIAAALAIGVGVGLAYGLREAIPSLIRGTTQVEPVLKPGQKVRFNGHAGTIQQAGAFNIILKNEEGHMIVIPTKELAEKEIVIESGPKPDISRLEKEAFVGGSSEEESHDKRRSRGVYRSSGEPVTSGS